MFILFIVTNAVFFCAYINIFRPISISKKDVLLFFFGLQYAQLKESLLHVFSEQQIWQFSCLIVDVNIAIICWYVLLQFLVHVDSLWLAHTFEVYAWKLSWSLLESLKL